MHSSAHTHGLKGILALVHVLLLQFISFLWKEVKFGKLK